MTEQLSEQFLLELFKGCLTSKNFLEIIIKHLKFHYIPEESYKKIFERITLDYELTQALPTIGSLTQHFSKDDNVLKVLLKIRNTTIPEQKEVMLQSFEKFIINAMFIDLYVRIGELHNEGKQDKAIKLLEQQSNIIASFSIKDNFYNKVFKDYTTRLADRRLKTKEHNEKVPFGIHALDFYSNGGMSKGTSTLILGRSGTGKSTFLRWVGLCAARLGFKVVHFQGEGTEEECMINYDAGWTAISVDDMEYGAISKDKVEAINKAHKDIVANGGEIFVKAAESFDEMTVNDCKDILDDIIKVHGKIDLVIFDYLEIFNVRGKYFNSETGERKRREDVANKMTNIATALNVAVLTATQANDIKPDKYNNPEFVMTRSDISEFKGAVKPFSNFITINQTDDEYERGVSRLWVDKFRKAKKPNIAIKLIQSLNNARFYDAKASLATFWDENAKKHKK